MYEITKHTIKALDEAILAMEEKQNRVNDLIVILGEKEEEIRSLVSQVISLGGEINNSKSEQSKNDKEPTK